MPCQPLSNVIRISTELRQQPVPCHEYIQCNDLHPASTIARHCLARVKPENQQALKHVALHDATCKLHAITRPVQIAKASCVCRHGSYCHGIPRGATPNLHGRWACQHGEGACMLSTRVPPDQRLFKYWFFNGLTCQTDELGCSQRELELPLLDEQWSCAAFPVGYQSPRARRDCDRGVWCTRPEECPFGYAWRWNQHPRGAAQTVIPASVMCNILTIAAPRVKTQVSPFGDHVCLVSGMDSGFTAEAEGAWQIFRMV